MTVRVRDDGRGRSGRGLVDGKTGPVDRPFFLLRGGVLVALPLFQLGGLVKSGSAELQAFAARPIDAATVVGGALFGAGWGLSGLCPGPGIVGAGAL